MTKVVLDAMGGDHAPDAILDGVALSLERGLLEPPQVILTGPEEQLRGKLEERGVADSGFQIADAPDVLSGTETPVDAMRRRRRNSIAVGIELLKEKRADCFVSAGNTGIVVAAATVGLRCLKGIRRPGIAVTIVGESGPFIIIDVGANPQPKAVHLLHYALMGAAYYRDAFGAESPRVGLVNIGSEDGKGNPLAREAGQLLRDAPINFVGNVEGSELFAGGCDVVVSDGFTGNVLLKASEGVAEYMLHAMATLMEEADVSDAKKNAILRKLLSRVDYSETGGALLLGVEGIVTICHGRSTGPAIASAIRFATKAAGAHLNQHIVAAARTVAGG